MKHELRHFSTHSQAMLELKPRIIPNHALTRPNFLIISTDFFVLLITALFPQYKVYPFLFSSSSKTQNQKIVQINCFINLTDCFFFSISIKFFRICKRNSSILWNMNSDISLITLRQCLNWNRGSFQFTHWPVQVFSLSRVTFLFCWLQFYFVNLLLVSIGS